jgi:hypothetical protein
MKTLDRLFADRLVEPQVQTAGDSAEWEDACLG